MPRNERFYPLVSRQFPTSSFRPKSHIETKFHEMMHTVTIQEAEQRLKELIRELHAGDELAITDNDIPIAKRTPLSQPSKRSPRTPGLGRGTCHHRQRTTYVKRQARKTLAQQPMLLGMEDDQ
jgi:antitoxin (DNA-binding transcriptional repressor) of toxin-antitoxin stability system